MQSSFALLRIIMPEIKVVTLGAGQDVGRSCVLISIGGKNIMLDCGMHPGFSDMRKFPDFSYLNQESGGNLDGYLTCIILSHFHLDHCGALPHVTEVIGYNGPIYMTYPTKAICPVLLEDYRRVQYDKGDTGIYTSAQVKSCMKKAVGMSLHEFVKVDDTLTIRAFYAGHVLGAAIYEIRVGSESVLYTGDYNTTPDRHLGAAQIIPGLKPDLLITETTYATTIRDSKRAREREFLKKVHDCVDRGGKVLIPVFALGRAQELCILIESYWERMDLRVPIYFSAGLAERANAYYRLFINWTNEKIKRTFVQRNMFDFKHIKAFDLSMAEDSGPMVLFATPGMLHAGQSLKVFKIWAPNPNNLIIMPGYCVANTPGHAVIQGARKVTIEGQVVDVNLGVEYMSFSAHADAKGIMQLIRDSAPRNVMFVHGEKIKMEFLKAKVEKEFGVPVFMPANGESISIDTPLQMKIRVPNSLLEHSRRMDPSLGKKNCPFNAYITLENASDADVKPVGGGQIALPQLKILSAESVAAQLELSLHQVDFTSNVSFKRPAKIEEHAQFWWSVVDNVSDHLDAIEIPITETSVEYGDGVKMELILEPSSTTDNVDANKDRFVVRVDWTLEEDELAERILAKLTQLAVKS